MKKYLSALTFILVNFSCQQAYAAPYCNGMWNDHQRFPLSFPHDQSKCECIACHLNGNLSTGGAGGGATCTSCHGGSRPLAKQKNTGHIITSADCSQCHRLKGSFSDANMNHSGLTECSTCHRKAGGHPEVNPASQCSVCHETTSWKCGG
jgi:hypothetical protein